jgi:predicted amidohydrolase YtcJ
MVTRTGWNGQTWGANERISVAEALALNTINGSYNSHEEDVKGSISIGKFADFVMLSDDLFTVDVSKIKDIQIVRTVVGGKPSTTPDVCNTFRHGRSTLSHGRS